MAASVYDVIPKEVENHIFKHNLIFRHLCVYEQPHWQSSGIITFLCKYYIVTSDALVGFFLDVLLFIARFNIIRASRETKKKKLSHRKKCKKEFMWETSPFWLHTLFSMSIDVDFLIYSLPPLKWRNCWMISINICSIAMGGILCDDIMSERRSKILRSFAI